MAKFCSRCGSLNDVSTGLCPSCDRAQLEALNAPRRRPHFCTVCGTPLDEQTGTCPQCTKPVEPVAAPVAESAPVDTGAGETEVLFVADGEAEVQPEADATVVLTPEMNEAELPVESPVDFGAVPPIPAAPEAVVPAAPQKSRVGKTILSVVLSVLLFVVSLLSVGLVCIRHTTSRGTIEAALNQIDLVEVIDYVYTESGFAEEGIDTFAECLSKYREDKYGYSISEKQLEKFIEKSTLKEFMAEKVADYVGDLLSGTDDFEITKSEINDFLHDNERVIEVCFNTRISDVANDELDELVDWLVDDEDLELFSDIKPSELLGDGSAAFYAVTFGTTYFTLAILLALVVLCLVGMGLNDLSQGAMGSGIVFTAIGGLLTAGTLVVLGLPTLLKSAIGNAVLASVLADILLENLVVFASVLGLGILLLVVRYLVRRFLRKLREKKAALNATVL